MRWPCIVACVLVACGDPVSVAETDGGRDAPAATRDVGSDTGLTASTIDPCTLAAPPVFARTASHAQTIGDALADRDFYVLSVLDHVAIDALAADTGVSAIATAHTMALHDADTASCDPACVRAALVRGDEAAAIDATMSALDDTVLTAIADALRASLDFERRVERGDDDRALVRGALTEAIANLTNALDAYAIAELPAAMLAPVVHAVASAPTPAWWQPLARVTTAAMIADGRDEAVRYEPITTGENAAAMAAVATTDFGAFPYVAILVPGQGPTDLTTALNPAGAARCDLAIARYRAGLAPFLLVSGGHVHPDRTAFSEAVEMKRYLMTTYDVPESAIFVDPYARHTTTNLRNAVRVLFAAGAPTAARVLIVSDRFQSLYIGSSGFGTRCDDELFYRPFVGLQVLSPTDTCMTMAPVSLTIASSDPLDP